MLAISNFLQFCACVIDGYLRSRNPKSVAAKPSYSVLHIKPREERKYKLPGPVPDYSKNDAITALFQSLHSLGRSICGFAAAYGSPPYESPYLSETIHWT